MLRLLIRTLIWLGSAAIGLIVAKLVLDDMSIDPGSFIVVVVVFAVVQAVLSPFIAKVAMRNASALLGGVGLLATLIALIAAEAVSSGFSIMGLDTWVAATLIVWIVTMLGSFLLPLLFAKRLAQGARRGSGSSI